MKRVSLILICLFIALSIFDAPEYVKCTHFVLCEFLEIRGLIPDLLDAKISGEAFLSQKNNFFSLLEGLLKGKEYIPSCSPANRLANAEVITTMAGTSKTTHRYDAIEGIIKNAPIAIPLNMKLKPI